MNLQALIRCSVLLLPIVVAGPAHAQQSQDDALRRAQTQLRQSEQERNALRIELAAVQRRLAEQTAQIEQLQAKLGGLSQEAASSRSSLSSARKQGADTASALDQARVQLTRLGEHAERQAIALKNLRTLYEGNLRKAKLQDELMSLCRTRNQEVQVIANEMLQEYRRVNKAGEPVFQLTKVRLENLVQDFEDRLREQRIYPDTLPPSVEQQMRENLEAARPVDAVPGPTS